MQMGVGVGGGVHLHTNMAYSEPDEDVSMRVGGKGALTDT